jgi:hypothetical protein
MAQIPCSHCGGFLFLNGDYSRTECTTCDFLAARGGAEGAASEGQQVSDGAEAARQDDPKKSGETKGAQPEPAEALFVPGTPTEPKAIAARLRSICREARIRPYPIADIIPTLQKAADAIDKFGAEPVSAPTPDAYARFIAWAKPFLWSSDKAAMDLAWVAYQAALDGEPVSARPASEPTALSLAIRFHDTYERLAPSFGYETRTDTKVFDPESKNGRLMVAVCAALGTKVLRAAESTERENAYWNAGFNAGLEKGKKIAGPSFPVQAEAPQITGGWTSGTVQGSK